MHAALLADEGRRQQGAAAGLFNPALLGNACTRQQVPALTTQLQAEAGCLSMPGAPCKHALHRKPPAVQPNKPGQHLAFRPFPLRL